MKKTKFKKAFRLSFEIKKQMAYCRKQIIKKEKYLYWIKRYDILQRRLDIVNRFLFFEISEQNKH